MGKEYNICENGFDIIKERDMLNNDKFINSLIYGDPVHKIAAQRNVGLTEAKLILSQMSFKEYCDLCEAVITPPSGQTIAPSTAGKPQTAPTASGPQKIKSIWPGKGAPPEVGMTVGIKGPNGLPVPGQISQVDMTAKGVKVKNPTTGQDEWTNIDSLQPYMVQGNSAQMQEELGNKLQRMKTLAGIKEECSGGATGAGAIAMAPTSMGSIKRRQPTDEELKKEYTPKGPAKTIVGDTKPHQASGELSANLAVRGKKTATRNNNGFKK